MIEKQKKRHSVSILFYLALAHSIPFSFFLCLMHSGGHTRTYTLDGNVQVIHVCLMPSDHGGEDDDDEEEKHCV